MIKGFGLFEIILALTVSLVVLTLVLSNVNGTVKQSKKVITQQQRMESLFHSVDMIRQDLTKCGMRLQEASHFFTFPLFENSNLSFKVVYGLEKETLLDSVLKGNTIIFVNRNEFFQTKRRIAIFDEKGEIYEINEIKGISGNKITLLYGLVNNYPKNASVVVLKEVEYRLYKDQNTLKRKVNKGNFQPIMEEVTNFYVKYYGEVRSVLYRIEINRKEQISGYIFLTNMEQ